MGRAVGTFGDRTERAANKGKAAFSAFGAVVKGIITTQILSRAWSVMESAITGAKDEFLDFDRVMTSITARIPGDIAKGTKAYDDLRAAIVAARSGTEFAGADAAKAMEAIVKKGLDANQALALLPGTLNRATVSAMSTADAATMTVDALRSFRLVTDDPIKLADNLRRMNNVITVAAKKGNLEDLMNMIQMTGPAAASAGASLESYGAIISMLGDQGVRGRTASTAIKSLVSSLAAPSKKAGQALQGMGVKAFDSTGKMRDLVDVIGDMKQKTDKMTQAHRLSTLALIFGKQAAAGINAVLSAGSGELAKYRDNMASVGDKVKETAEKMRQSTEMKLKILKQNFQETFVRIFEILEKEFPNAIGSAIGALDRIDAGTVSSAINEAVFAVETLGEVVKKNQDALLFMANLGAAIWVVAKAQEAWNIAMKANPLLMLVAGVVAWISVIQTLRSEWGFVSNMFKETITAVQLKFLNMERSMRSALHMDTEDIDKRIAEMSGTPGAKTPEQKRWADTYEKANRPYSEEELTGPGYSGAPTGAPAQPYTAPNAAQVAATGGWKGTLNIKGAPDGSTLEQRHTGAPRLDAALLGANP